MYKLYYMSGACSMAIHAILNELNQKVELESVRVPEGQPRSAEFLKVNPRGQVPTLVEDDGNVIREGGAIITYLLDKHNSEMLPKAGKERAKALEWLMFANATMHPAYSRVFIAFRAPLEQKAKDALIKFSGEQINKLWQDVDGHLANNKFVCGNKVSAADILLAVIANWGIGMFPFEVKHGENVKRMLKEVVAMPSFKAALEKEGVQYKAL